MKIAIAFIGIVALCLAAPAAESRLFQAGAAVVDITPPLGTRINGNFWPGVAREVHDPLQVRALVLDDGKTKLAFAVADNCLITRDVFDEAKEIIQQKTGLAPGAVMLSATHTHSAGAVADCYLTDAEPDYKKLLPDKFAAAVQQALSKLESALIGWGRVDVPQHVFCRRWILKPGTGPENPFGSRDDRVKMNPAVGSPDLVAPAGPVDPELAFVSVQTADRKPLAVLANYSLHYVGDVGPGHFSADYFAVFAAKLAGKLNAPPTFVGIMSNGTSANVNSINFRGTDARPSGNYQRINLVGEDTAVAVARAIENLEHRPWAELRHAQRDLTLRVRKPGASDIAAAKKLAEGRPPGLFKNLAEVYARETLLLDRFPDTITQLVQAFRIGDLAIGGISNEVFTETGLALKKASPIQPYFTISLANGWNGYLPPRSQHELGGYETWRSRTSYLDADSESKIQTAMIEVLGDLK